MIHEFIELNFQIPLAISHFLPRTRKIVAVPNKGSRYKDVGV
jgi:hypothetical protein